MYFARCISSIVFSLVLLCSTKTACGQETSLDTILTTTCDGTIRLFPDNLLLNVNVDGPFIPRMFAKFVDGLQNYVKKKCGSAFNENVFQERFDIGRFLLVGNKWFNDVESRSDPCLDSPETFTRDGLKMYGVLFTDDMHFDMPSTCNWDSWDRSGSCAFEYAVRGIQEVTLQVRIERCKMYRGFPRVSVGCRGKGCSILTPCSDSSMCGADQRCTDVADFVKRDNLISILTAVGFYESKKTAGDPRRLIENAIATFGALFPGGVQTGASVCLPMVFSRSMIYDADPWIMRGILSQFGGAWKFSEYFNFGSTSGCNTATQNKWVNDIVGYKNMKYITQYILTESLMNPWDGLVNGTTPFEPKTNWVAIPNVKYPKNEDHIVSVQCDGVIHAFAGTAFPVRIYHPKLTDILEFWAAQSMAVYPLDESDFLNNMAIWRLEPYLNTMQGSNMFGNIANIWQPDFTFNFGAPAMEILELRKWETNKGMNVSVGLREDVFNPLGSDFRVNIRAAQCSGQSTGLTSVDITCQGRVCEELLLRKTCTDEMRCAVGKCRMLSGYYENDYIAQILWGVDDLLIPEPWAGKVKCAAGKHPGKNYQKLTTQPGRGMLNGMWIGMQYANCAGRTTDKCLGECVMNGPTCEPVNGVPPIWNSNVGFCFPDLANLEDSMYTKVNKKITFANISTANQALYTSAKVVIDPFPEPTNPVPKPAEAYAGVETIVMGTCEGQFRVFPDNELLSISIDAEIIPRVFGEYMKAIDRYVTARCEAKGKTPPNLNDPKGRYLKRFHPLSYFVYSGIVDEYDSCLDDSDTFVRDFLKIFKEKKMNQTVLYFPETCNNVTWFEQGSCKMKVPLKFIPDAVLTVDIERCDTNYGYVRFAAGCEGGGCNAMINPCNHDSDCGGNSRCINPIDEIGSNEVFKFMRDTLHYFAPQEKQSNGAQDLFNEFVTKFGPYFKGSPISGVGNRKICFPKEYVTNQRQYYWSPPGIKTYRMTERSNLCGAVVEWEWNSNGRPSSNYAETYRLDPGSFPGAGGKKYSHAKGSLKFARDIYGTDSSMKEIRFGGAVCKTHDDCTWGDVQNLCMSSHDMCKMNGWRCHNNSYSKTDYKCACSVEQTLPSCGTLWENMISYGDSCQLKTARIFYTKIFRYNGMAAPDVPTFLSWNGLLKDGKTHFQREVEWPHFPEVKIPVGETHVMSVQCDGLITFFEGTPFSIRIYLPKKQELLQFIADKYITSMSSWIPQGLDPVSAFNREQALWRPEVYLARLLEGTKEFDWFSSVAGEFDFGKDVLGLGDFTYEKFVKEKESGVGFSYSGMKDLMGNDFKANVRFQQCSAYPNGLVGMDLTCVGEVCKTLQLQRPCVVNSDCTIGSCISTDFYNNDLMAGALWGTSAEGLKCYNDWITKTTCPATTKLGFSGVAETNNSKLYQTGASIYSLAITESCSGRPQCACVSGCTWNGRACLASASVDPVWEQQEIKVCLPDILQYSAWAIGEPNSADICRKKKGMTMGNYVTVYALHYFEIMELGTATVNNVILPNFSCATDSSGSGSSGDSSYSDGGSDSGNGDSSSYSDSGSDSSGDSSYSDGSSYSGNGDSSSYSDSGSDSSGDSSYSDGGSYSGNGDSSSYSDSGSDSSGDSSYSDGSSYSGNGDSSSYSGGGSYSGNQNANDSNNRSNSNTMLIVLVTLLTVGVLSVAIGCLFFAQKGPFKRKHTHVFVDQEMSGSEEDHVDN